MASEKKCPHCGEWTPWNVSLDDQCVHCGEYLLKRDRDEQSARETRLEEQRQRNPFTIKPTDSTFRRIFKRVGYVLYMIYMALAGFVAWLAFWLSG